MFALALLDLTLREVITDLPHDAGALVAYLMLALFIGFTVMGSRRRSSPDDATSTTSPES
jgi:hypothetical protein